MKTLISDEKLVFVSKTSEYVARPNGIIEVLNEFDNFQQSALIKMFLTSTNIQNPAAQSDSNLRQTTSM